MKKMIRKAFDPIRADADLIARTREAVRAGAPGVAEVPVRRRGRPVRRGLAGVTAFLLLVGLFSLGAIALFRIPAAAVSLDINPSVELEVNALGRVVSAQAFNEEGEVLLAGLELAGRPARQAIHAVIAAASEAGYLEPDGSSIIAITTAADLERLRTRLEKAAAEAAGEALGETGGDAVVYGEGIGLERVKAARLLGITPGRLNLIEKLIALDPSRTVEEFLDAKASDIMKQVVALQQAAGKPEREPETSETEDPEGTMPSEQAVEKAVRASEKAAEKAARASEKAAAQAARDAEKAARMAEAVGQAEERESGASSGN